MQLIVTKQGKSKHFRKNSAMNEAKHEKTISIYKHITLISLMAHA